MHMPVNIGNPDEISLKDFAEEVIELTGNKVKIIYKPLPQMIQNNASRILQKQKNFELGTKS